MQTFDAKDTYNYGTDLQNRTNNSYNKHIKLRLVSVLRGLPFH